MSTFQIEQKMIEALGGLVDVQKAIVGLTPRQETAAERLLKSADFARFQQGGDLCKIDLTPLEVKTAIVGTGAVNDPLVASGKPFADPGKRRAIKIRDFLPTFPTVNGAIEMPVKTSGSAAGIQVAGSPGQPQNVTLPEAAYEFESSFIPIETIGHWLPVSKQIFEDSGALQALIEGELLHGLAQAEQDQLLNGTGTGHTLFGLIQGAAALTQTSPLTTNKADIIRMAIRQIELADFAPNVIILNPSDWHSIEIRKSEASVDDYAAGAPRHMATPSLWGLPVISTPAIAQGSFLVGDLTRAAILFDRQQAQVELARHDSSNFQKGMLTLRAVERLALVIANSTALITGAV